MRRALLVIAVALVTGACAGSAAESRCEALVGPEPWLILHAEAGYGAECVSVGVHQDVQIWNKGTEQLTLEWRGGIQELASDSRYATGPIGEIAAPGVYPIESHPYPAPDIHVVAPGDSWSAEAEVSTTAYGPIELGMSLAEAAQVSGQSVVVHPDQAPGPDCWIAVVEGDPYSPLFTVSGSSDDDSVIEFITTYYPAEEAVTINATDATVSWACS